MARIYDEVAFTGVAVQVNKNISLILASAIREYYLFTVSEGNVIALAIVRETFIDWGAFGEPHSKPIVVFVLNCGRFQPEVEWGAFIEDLDLRIQLRLRLFEIPFSRLVAVDDL